MTSPRSPKRHHIIPILHLKHFISATPKGQLWTIDKDTGDCRSATSENTAVVSHFYSAETDDGTFYTGMEETLAQIESAAAPVYEKLAKAQPITDDEKANFAAFLALMYLRTPAVRRDAAEVIGRGIQIMSYAYGTNEKAFEGLIKRFEKGEGRTLTEIEKKKLREVLIDPTHLTFEIPKERTFMVFRAIKDLMPILFNMNWGIIGAVHGFFITSDNPVVRWVDPKTQHRILGDHGFHNKTVEVTFPLTPQATLIAAWQEIPNLSVLDRDNVWRMNMMRASHADKYLFAHTCNTELKKLATDFKGSRPRLTSSGFGPKKFGKINVPRRLR